MNPALKTHLLSTLRSGRYTQTTEQLRNDTGFCVLGVMTDLAFQAGHPGHWEFSPTSSCYLPQIFGITYTDQQLPLPLLTFYELDRPARGFEVPLTHAPDHVLRAINTQLETELHYQRSETVILSDLNDSGLSFALLADLIEHSA